MKEMNFNDSILHNSLSIWLLIASSIILIAAGLLKKKLYYYMLLIPLFLHFPITYYGIQRNGRVYDDLDDCYVLINYTWEFDIINTVVLLIFYYLLTVKIDGKNIWSTLI